jgi:hypothetical protein
LKSERSEKRSDGEWERLLAEWRKSGQTQSGFARAHGVNPRTFQGRVYRSRKQRGMGPKELIPSKYVEVTPAMPDAAISQEKNRITMSNLSIEFSSVSDTKWVLEILSSLGHGR